MSLVSFALRLAVTRLLAGNTWADDRIVNSPLDPIQDLLDGAVQDKPMIAVFTNDEEGMNQGRDIGGRPGTLDLIFFIYLPPAVVSVDDNGTPAEFEARTGGGASVLNFVSHQIRTALRFGPAAWRAVYEAMVISVTKVRSRPILVEMENGVRIPAREIIMSMDVLAEPDVATPLKPHWLALDAAMRADADAEPMADLIKAMIETPANLNSWQLARANLAVSLDTIRALGLSPVDTTETGEAAELDDVDLSGENVVVAPEGLGI